MSDTPPANPQSETTEVSAAVASAKSEITALLDDLKARKTAFDSIADTSTKAITGEIDKAKAAGQEIATLRNDAVSAKGAMDTERNDFLTKTKTVQTEIEATRNAIATVKGAIETTQKAAVSDASVVAQSKIDIEKTKASVNALSEQLTKEHDAVAKQISELQKTKDSLAEILQQLSEAKVTAGGDASAVKTYLDEVNNTKDRLANLNSSSGEQYDELKKKQDGIQSKITEIEEAHGAIRALRKELLESSDQSKSVQDEINELRGQIRTTLENLDTDRGAAASALSALRDKTDADTKILMDNSRTGFDNLYKDLETKILALLPSAGAAGLASTYYDAKSRYAPTSYAGKPGGTPLLGWRKYLRTSVGNNPASVVATLFFYALFLLPLGLLAWGTYDLVWQLEHNPAFHFDYRLLALRFLIAVPLAAISGFGFASLRLYRKLYEEYNHKQRVMELYRSFRNEIETSGDKEQVKSLLTIMLDAVASKAWENAKAEETKDEDAIATIGRLSELTTKLRGLMGSA